MMQIQENLEQCEKNILEMEKYTNVFQCDNRGNKCQFGALNKSDLDQGLAINDHNFVH